MLKKISLLMPTRGRPDWVKRFCDSVMNTANNLSTIELILYVDDDDYNSHDLSYDGFNVKTIIGPRMTMGEYNSECFRQASGDIIVLVNDDMIIQSKSWDNKLRELDDSVPDKIYLAYGNDLFKKEDLCTFPILSRKTCKILQQPYHEAYRGAFIDYHLMDIFKRLEKAGYHRIVYLKEVVFEHLHYRAGKSEIDETYKLRGRFNDDMLFVGLAKVRATSYINLFQVIDNCQEYEIVGLPEFLEPKKPTNIFYAVSMFFKTFIRDKQLPWKWKLFMFWWFSARYIASYILK